MGHGTKVQVPHFSRPPAPPETIWQAQGNGPVAAIEGAGVLPTRTAFEAFSARDDVPGQLGVREVKFLIADVRADAPQLYFMNSSRNPMHFNFARDHLGIKIDIPEFNRATYFTQARDFIAGTVLAYDNYAMPDGSPGLYVMEFWPTDPVPVDLVVMAYTMVQAGMPFARDVLAYHPTGDVQEQQFARDADTFAAADVRTVSTSELFDGVSYSALNLGDAVGMLRRVTGDDPRPPTASDIVIYDTLPNDLPIVAGVITAAPQTSLSHVNLRAQQNNIANAYLRDAGNNPLLNEFIGQPVRLSVLEDGLQVVPLSNAEMYAALDARRPSEAQIPPRDLGPRSIVALNDLAWGDVRAFGAKASNLAELRRAIDPQFVPDGFAVPFSFYHDFMVANGLYDDVQALLVDPAMQDDTQRKDMLKTFRKTIKNAPLTTPMRDQLDAMHRAFPEGTTPRCRSSANNEDLVGFTGAGLYDSYTHRLDEGHIEKSIKQVWASLWTYRAFNERDFYRIDHMTAAMGVLVHPNFDDERVNGVALTRNLYFPQFEGYFINAQVGEDRVTNPDGTQTAEEVLVLQNIDTGNTKSYEMIYIRRSSLVAEDEMVIGMQDLLVLTAQLKKIQTHFAALYGMASDDRFAMDVEFKFDRDGLLAIKQARPWTG